MLQLHKPASPLHWSWVSMVGPDARDFLHRLTTVNTKQLAPGEGSPGCFLNAQGRIKAYFRLWCYGPDEYAFEFDAGASDSWKKDLLAVIDQFTFAEKFQIADITGLECRWLFPDADTQLPFALSSHQTLADEEEIRVCHQGSADFGRPWITVWGRAQRLEQWVERSFPDVRKIGWDALQSWRIGANRPWIQQEILPDSNPLEVGLLDAIAQNKGCYPGQEVIEKIISLGSPAKRLVRLEGSGEAPRPGTKILSRAEPPQDVGQLTSATSLGDGRFAALAIVRKIHAKEGMEVQLEPASTGSSPMLAQVVQVAPYA